MLTQRRLALRMQQRTFAGLQGNGGIMQAGSQRSARGKEMFGDARKRGRSRRSGHYAPARFKSLFQSPARSCMPLRAGTGYISNTGSG